MTALTWTLVALSAMLAVILIDWISTAVRYYRKFHGKRLITCPETHEHEAVEVDAAAGAIKKLFQPTALKLRTCTRWPERQDCGQFCLSQIESAPVDCLVTNIVAKWYAGKVCIYCGKPFEAINWLEHKPALRDASGRTVQWDEVRVERLPEILASSAPVCWTCHVAEAFRREHQDLVTDRNSRHAA